jgi:hypothetical protein
MIRKNICLSILLLSTLTISIPVNAEEPTPEVTQAVQQTEPQQVDAQKEQLIPQISLIQYSNVSSSNASLSITSSGSVSASAYIAGYPSTTTKITGYLYLERKSGSSWVTDWSWSANTASAYLSMNNSCNVSIRGTYRLRLSGYVYAGTTYEQITTYSSEFTY